MEAVASECAFPVNCETTLVRSNDGCNLRLGKFLEKRHGWLAMRDPGVLCAFSIDVGFFVHGRFRVFIEEFNRVWNECALILFWTSEIGVPELSAHSRNHDLRRRFAVDPSDQSSAVLFFC